MAQDIEEGENPNIDADTRARAMASVANLGKPVAVPVKPSAAAPAYGMTLAERTTPAYGMTLADRTTPRNKPSVVTNEQLKAFKAKYGADKDLTDYMNDQAGGLKRRKPAPVAAPAEVPVARSEVKNTLNDLRAKSKEQQARGAALRAETNSVLGENAAKQQADFKRSLGVKDYLESSSYAKGGSINLSNCKISTAQKNSSSPKW
jgi:hypothetical protein